MLRHRRINLFRETHFNFLLRSGCGRFRLTPQRGDRTNWPRRGSEEGAHLVTMRELENRFRCGTWQKVIGAL